jgi:hypothetical protein
MSTDLIEAVVADAVKSHDLAPLIGKLLELPQPRNNVRHIFGNGVYMREIAVQAGILLIGRKHRGPHGCLLIKGRLQFFNEDGTRTEMVAPAEFEAGAGRKVATFLEDTIFVNTFATNETDVDTLEAMIFEDEAPADPRPMLEPDGDFEAVLAAEGADPAAVRRASERTDDQCPFPYGAYKVKVGRSLIEGRGLIATADIAAGEYIAPGTWGNCRTPAGRYTNHAKDPNAYFQYDGAGTAWLIAKRAIAGSTGAWAGEEVTIDYRHTPRSRWENLS